MIISKTNNFKIYGKNITYSIIKTDNNMYESYLKLDNKNLNVISNSFEEANKFIIHQIKNIFKGINYD